MSVIVFCKGLGLYLCEREVFCVFEYVCTVLSRRETVVCVCVLGDCVREREQERVHQRKIVCYHIRKKD